MNGMNIDMYPRYNSGFINYIPSSKIINAFVNTIDFIKDITSKFTIDEIINFKFAKEPDNEIIDNLGDDISNLSNKRNKIRNIYISYKENLDYYSRISENEESSLEYNIAWVNLVDEIIDLILFFNRCYPEWSIESEYDKNTYLRASENDSLTTKYFKGNYYTIEFELTEINDTFLNNTNLVENMIKGTKNITFIRLYKNDQLNKALFDFVQGSEPEINNIEEAIIYENIIEDICLSISNVMTECFSSVLCNYLYRYKMKNGCLLGKNCWYKNIRLIEEERIYVQLYTESSRDDNRSTHKRHSFWSLFSRNSV